MKLTNEICISFLRGSGWLYNHDKEITISEHNKAIDDLQNELKNHYTEYDIDCVLADTSFYSYTTACNYFEDYIDEIAEQLKEGRENETDKS